MYRFSVDTSCAEDEWEEVHEEGCLKYQGVAMGFSSLFSPSLHYYSSTYDVVSRPLDIDLLIDNPDSIPVTVVEHKGRFIHATPIRLPMLPVREFFLPDHDEVKEYRAVLSCGPEDNPDSFYTLKVVLFGDEKGVPCRILPHTLDVIDRDDIELDEVEIISLNLPMPAKTRNERFAGDSYRHVMAADEKAGREKELLAGMLKDLSLRN